MSWFNIDDNLKSKLGEFKTTLSSIKNSILEMEPAEIKVYKDEDPEMKDSNTQIDNKTWSDNQDWDNNDEVSTQHSTVLSESSNFQKQGSQLQALLDKNKQENFALRTQIDKMKAELEQNAILNKDLDKYHLSKLEELLGKFQEIQKLPISFEILNNMTFNVTDFDDGVEKLKNYFDIIFQSLTSISSNVSLSQNRSEEDMKLSKMRIQAFVSIIRNDVTEIFLNYESRLTSSDQSDLMEIIDEVRSTLKNRFDQILEEINTSINLGEHISDIVKKTVFSDFDAEVFCAKLKELSIELSDNSNIQIRDESIRFNTCYPLATIEVLVQIREILTKFMSDFIVPLSKIFPSLLPFDNLQIKLLNLQESLEMTKKFQVSFYLKNLSLQDEINKLLQESSIMMCHLCTVDQIFTFQQMESERDLQTVERLSFLESEYDRKSGDVNQLSDQLMSANSENTLLKEKVTTMTSQISEIAYKDTQIRDLSDSIDKMKFEFENEKIKSQSKVDHFSSEVTRLRDHLVSVENEYSVQLSKLMEENTLLSQLKENFQSECDRLRDMLQENRSNNAKSSKTLTDQLSAYHTENSRLQDELNSIKQVCESHVASMSLLQSSISDIEMQSKSHIDFIKENCENEKLQLVEKNKMELEQQLSAIKENYQDKIAKLQESHESELQNLQCQLNSSLRKYKDLHNEFIDVSASYSQLRNSKLSSFSYYEQNSLDESIFSSPMSSRSVSLISPTKPALFDDTVKFDKLLIKNMLLSLFSTTSDSFEKRSVIIKVLSTYLEFSMDESYQMSEMVKRMTFTTSMLETATSWLPRLGLTFPAAGPPDLTNSSDKTLAELLIQYLEYQAADNDDSDNSHGQNMKASDVKGMTLEELTQLLYKNKKSNPENNNTTQ